MSYVVVNPWLSCFSLQYKERERERDREWMTSHGSHLALRAHVGVV